jgi:hypothetical protein
MAKRKPDPGPRDEEAELCNDVLDNCMRAASEAEREQPLIEGGLAC